MKCFVTGAEGMVGHYVPSVFSKDEVVLTDRATLDITDFPAVRRQLKEQKPDIILHLAAATDVDRCQAEIDWAYRTNVIGTQNVATVCSEENIPLVYVSTGGVFNGAKTEAYTEFDSPDPLNVYAKTKWEGEKIVQQISKRAFIVRAGWMIGGGEKDKKFVAKMVEFCRTREIVQAVDDKVGTLTYAKDFLTALRPLLETSFYGIYHIANQGICSRYDIALEIAKLTKSKARIEPVASTLFPLPAPRPRSEAIVGYRMALMGFPPMPAWQDALHRYLSEWLR